MNVSFTPQLIGEILKLSNLLVKQETLDWVKQLHRKDELIIRIKARSEKIQTEK